MRRIFPTCGLPPAVFLLALSLGLALFSVASPAQQPDQIARYKDWFAFVSGKGKNKICFIASQPQKSQPGNVRRGDIYFLVTHDPAKNIRSEASVMIGYPFRKDSTLIARIDDAEFSLMTQGENAWTKSPEEDRTLLHAMKRGRKMVLNGVSSRGTRTTDVFSLLGVTAAMKKIDD